MQPPITSLQNPLAKQIRRLRRSKSAREQEGLFLVEGIQGVVEAVESGAPLAIIVYAPDLLTSEIAYRALDKARARGVECVSFSAPLFTALSERDNPVGIAALVERRLLPLDELSVTSAGLYVTLVEASDPGNLGTILRTADAAGADALLLVGQTVDPFHPTAVKASAGTVFSVPIVFLPDLDALLRWSEAEGVPLVATSDRGAQEYWSVRYPSPLVLVMGSEAHGLPHLERFPQVVRIPMHGHADSLNLGVATALLLYEIRRQRQTVPSGGDDIP